MLLTVIFVKGVNETVCQEYCQLYSTISNCQFFIYDKTYKICEVFDYPDIDFMKSCNKIGGTYSPDFTTCNTQDAIIEDPCIVSQSF